MNRDDTHALALLREEDMLLTRAYLLSELRIIPLLFILWMLAWVDRANISFAKLQMLEDLRFGEATYGFGSGMFFLGYCAFGLPAVLLQQKLGAKRILAAAAIGWGLTSATMTLVSSPMEFYFVRFLLGAFESGFYPGVILYFGSWFSAQRRARNFSIFHSGAICSTVAIGLIGGFVLDTMSGWLSLAGWRWMFLVEAVPTVVFGLILLRHLPDGPQTASWLSVQERDLIMRDVSAKDVLDTEKARPGRILATSRLWTLSAIYFCILSANAALSFYIPSILHEAGFGSYTNIGNAIAAICILGAVGNVVFCAFASRYREIQIFCGIASLMSVAALVTLTFVWHDNQAATFVALVVGLAGTGAGVSLFWQTPPRYLHPRVLAVAVPLISSIANMAGFLTPSLTGYVRELFGSYAAGFLTAAGAQAVAGVLLIAALPTAIGRFGKRPGIDKKQVLT